MLIIAAVAIGVATPLGAAIGRGLADFSAWLTGEPGTPASESEQREFEAANAYHELRDKPYIRWKLPDAPPPDLDLTPRKK